MKLENKRVHFIGICGISLSALAIMSKNLGAIVSGSDISKGEMFDRLNELGITVFLGHSANNLNNAQIVVYSSAINEDNPELKFARANNLKILKRAEFLNELSKAYKTIIAVSGCHGKTTTTAMISQILIDAGLDPTIHIGGEFSLINGNVRIGGYDYFVSEACEYKNNFLKLNPTISVVLNVQPDHLDFFKTFKNVKIAFSKFMSKTKKEGLVITNFDDKNISCPVHRKNITFSLNNGGDVNAVNLKLHDDGTYSFDCLIDGAIKGNVKLGVCGKHNIYNAMAGIIVGLYLKIPFEKIVASLQNFKGVDRRFQLIGHINGANLIIDYAHHPTEIEGSLIAAKTFTKGKLIAIFQPHTFSRTKSFFNEFVKSLSMADTIGFYKIYPAREEPIEGIDHFALTKYANKMELNAFALSDYDELKKFIYDNSQERNTILLLGAGDYVEICKQLEFD